MIMEIQFISFLFTMLASIALLAMGIILIRQYIDELKELIKKNKITRT